MIVDMNLTWDGDIRSIQNILAPDIGWSSLTSTVSELRFLLTSEISQGLGW